MPSDDFPLGRPARLAVFASGRGSNLSSLLAAFPPIATTARRAVTGSDETAANDAGANDIGANDVGSNDIGSNDPTQELGNIVLVVSNVAGAPVLEKAAAAGVSTVEVPWRGRAAFEDAASKALEQHRIDLVCLAGFMRVLSKEFTTRYAGRLLNVHPSLLPLFPGLAAPQQALEAGVAESGCTVHFVDAGVDTGAKIVQRKVPVLPGDDAASLAERILAEEQLAYPEAVRRVLTGAVQKAATE